MDRIEKVKERFMDGFNCSQAVFSAFASNFGLNEEMALRIASGFGGGLGRCGYVCGAVSGAIMVIGLKYGFLTPKDEEAKLKVYSKVKKFIEEFLKENNSIICKDLLGEDISTEEGLKKIKEKNLFKTICPKYVEDSARILSEILKEK
jgi:C_GCAxxG_C_C family probable redox protein